MNKRAVGTLKEQAAAEYLQQQGCRIEAVNFRCRFGEIDLIVTDPEGFVCFVEVKYRRSSAAGYPQEAVHRKKQYTICRTADYYRLRRKMADTAKCRFDVVAVLGSEIVWIRNAFPYIPYGKTK